MAINLLRRAMAINLLRRAMAINLLRRVLWHSKVSVDNSSLLSVKTLQLTCKSNYESPNVFEADNELTRFSVYNSGKRNCLQGE